jgi:hypothetical protein
LLKKGQKRKAAGSRKTKSYEDAFSLGWRVGDINISVEKGNSEKVAGEIFATNASVQEVTLRIDSSANVTARIYYKSSEELNDIMERIRAKPFVKSVHFSEIIKVIRARDIGKANDIFEGRVLSKLQDSSKRL